VQNLSGMVSRSEYHKGLFSNLKNKKIHLFPRGSIAFKLGLLASSACDFIVSKNPKNVWDIAAGTILVNQRGYHFFEDGKRVEKLDKERYHGLLLWCKDEHLDELMAEFQ
jgi:myo-inositol-1(or 4)-monophosphatase